MTSSLSPVLLVGGGMFQAVLSLLAGSTSPLVKGFKKSPTYHES